MKTGSLMRRPLLSLLALVLLSMPAQAQMSAPGSTGLHVTRAELQDLLARYEAAAAAGGQSGAAAANEALLIRQRLEEGDMRVGDRVLVLVEGYPQFSDTFNVVAGRRIVLPDIGDVPLTGVLRAEVEDVLRRAIGGYLRNPTVHARTLIRLEIRGAVNRPGFYAIPADMLVSDALMVAGGPAGRGDVERVRINRGRDVLWDAARLRAAVIDGRTLDQLGVRAGDGIIVPEQRSSMATVREGMLLVTGIASLIFVLNRAGVF
jgi:protein involved in polysaccharide export with SLBB domain